MIKKSNDQNDQPVTAAMLDKALRASEERTLKAVATMIETSIQTSEKNTAELIADLTAHIDSRFNRLESRVWQIETDVERIDNHSIRLAALETAAA